MEKKKRWFRKTSLNGRSISQALKSAYYMPKRTKRFNFFVFLGSGLFIGLMYAVLVFVICLSIGEDFSSIISRSIVSGVGFGLLMAAIRELWDMGFMVERILTIVLGCVLVIIVC